MSEPWETVQADAAIRAGPESETSLAARRRNRRRPLWLSGAALLLVVLAGGLVLLRLRNPAAVPIPAEVGGLSLTSQAFGKEAAEHIVHLHGKGFPMTGAAVGEYGDGQATLWVSRTIGRLGAQAQIRAMTEAIAKGTSPFEPTAVQEINGCTVYALMGMGQSHFYFRAGDQIIWLAVTSERADPALRGLLNYYAPAPGC